MKKLRKTFMKRVDGWSLCKSVCSPIWFRPVHEKIVRERLPMGSAFYGERLRDIVWFFGGEYLLGGDFSVNLVFSAFAVGNTTFS